MKKKIMSMVTVLMMITSMILSMPMEQVQAAEGSKIVDGSVLLDDAEESIGEMIIETRGQYLQKGISSIGEIGTGKIKVSGTTIAQKVVSTVKILVRVEQLVNGRWVSYTSWQASAKNTYKVNIAKTLTVPRGYYYRVWSTHTANSDLGNSNTGGLYVD